MLIDILERNINRPRTDREGGMVPTKSLSEGKITKGKTNGKSFGVEMVELSKLKPHPRNYREHPPDQLSHVIVSIETNGLYRNVVVAKDLTILAGHAVVQACMKMKMKSIPVVRLSLDPDHPKALKVLAGDNQIGDLALIDDRVLTDMLKEILDIEGDLIGSGFDEQMLAARMFVTRQRSEVAEFDEAAEWVGMPDFDPGETRYTLSLHFRSSEDREKFVVQKKIEVVRGDQGTDGEEKKVWSAWWPPSEKADRKSVRWEGESA